MANKILTIIIDADIARASSLTEHPVSSSGRKVLDVVSSSKHSICLCPKLLKEWKKHRSGYSTKWLASMFAKKKVEIKDNDHVIEKLIALIDDDSKYKEIALKDAHLIDSSLVNSKIIFSNDENARRAFIYLSDRVGDIQLIAWFNSITEKDLIVKSLHKGDIPAEASFLKNEKLY